MTLLLQLLAIVALTILNGPDDSRLLAIRATVARMNRIVVLLGGLSLSTLAVQACSDSSDDGDTQADAGTSSGSQGTGSSGSSESSSSSGGGGSTSSSGSSGGKSSSSSSSSSGDAQGADRCIRAADRAQARYEACDVNVLILDGGTPEACTDARAASGERIADCVEATSCPTLRGQADASAEESAAYYECVGG